MRKCKLQVDRCSLVEPIDGYQTFSYKFTSIFYFLSVRAFKYTFAPTEIEFLWWKFGSPGDQKSNKFHFPLNC